jgi:hypothetical protein
MKKIVWNSCLQAIVLLWTSNVGAQQSPSPGSVNNCTQLTDPTQLRRCIEAQQGVTSQPEWLSVSPSSPNKPDPYRRLDNDSAKSIKPNHPP